MNDYNETYYNANSQDGDRIALAWYSKWLKKHCKNSRDALDFGCGTGFFMLRLSKYFSVSGYDISAFGRSEAAKRVKGAILYDNSADIPDSSQDLVTSLHVLEHIEQPLVALREIYRILRPGGLAFVVVPDTDGKGHKLKGTNWFAYKDPTHCTFLSSSEWCKLAKAANFVVEIEGSDGLWDSPYSKFPRLLDRVVYGLPLIVNVVTTTIQLRPNRGECTILLLRRPHG